MPTIRPSRLLLCVSAAAALAGCHHQKVRPQPELVASKVTTIGVNSFLWRATLDTLSFMPLTQTDSNGGVVVTDWYSYPSTPGERIRLTVYVLDQDLRADALRVTGERQLQQNGQWVSAPLAAQTTQRLEEIILSKARDLRRAASGLG